MNRDHQGRIGAGKKKEGKDTLCFLPLVHRETTMWARGQDSECVGRDRCQAGGQTLISRESQSSAGKRLADPVPKPGPQPSNQISKPSCAHGV